MSYKFVTESFENEIYKNVIGRVFPNLNSTHGKLLLNYLVKLLNIISVSFNQKHDNFEHQIRQNNYLDATTLMLQLLPFINDDESVDKRELRSLDELYTAKMKNVDINKNEPKYVYSNLQYGRCNRDNGRASEINFNKEHLENNFYLLVETVRRCSNKLYVNWIDVIPYTNDDIKNSSVYKISSKRHENGTHVDFDIINDTNNLDDSSLAKLDGLYVGDIYDTLSNEFYYNIKQVKWMLYSIKLINKAMPYYTLLPYFIPVDGINKNMEWKEQSDEARNEFTNRWNKFIEIVDSGSDLTIHGNLSITNSQLKEITKSITIFFNNFYENILIAENKGYKKINFKRDGMQGEFDIEEYEDDKLKDITYNTVRYSFKSISGEHIYTYLKNCESKLQQTWFHKEFELRYANSDDPNSEGIDLNIVDNAPIKAYYNFAKSMCHYDKDGVFTEYPRYWVSLTSVQKREILSRLNEKNNYMNWFNINRYISKTYGISNKADINAKRKIIFTNIHGKLIDHIFDSLQRRGILSMFQPNKNLTDESFGGDLREKIRNNTRQKYTINSKYSTESYYYLTSKPYGKMADYSYKIKKGEEKEIVKGHFFSFLADDSGVWYNAYGVNWVTQICFFHKYYNNRVIYVTGSTGVGKSTQIPKLLLYALKAVDYKSAGSIACTQPRITPTESNAKRVSEELGLPVTEGNYYIQYKHKKDSKVKRVDHLSLEFTTDGSLVQKLKSTPLLKKTYQDNDSGGTMYDISNLYDIVAVDEAHEHNTNMDIILTLVKYGAYYNNSIKLVIISATMADDEPNYRRYYRDINDNKMFPFSTTLEENKLDRINVERRLHISPPGKTTKWKITDIYNKTDQPIDIIQSIISNDTTGDILLFQPGVMEITKSMEELNKVLPPNMIAVPYHAGLNENQRTLIENIASTKYSIKMDRNIPFTEIDDPTRGDSSYNRVVIVATNIAEASITIDSLKYVVETGNQKTAIYDFKKKFKSLKLTPISESSRLQRRGRVGRVGPGTVYYLYEQGAVENQKTQFKISIDNIDENLYAMLYDRSNESPLFDSNTDPNKLRSDHKLSGTAILPIVSDKYKYNLNLIISKQYFNNGNYISYYGNNSHYDYGNNKLNHLVYETGYSLESLSDNDGNFYIIHPDELGFVRNILGNITEIKKDYNGLHLDNGKLVSDKINSFWKIMEDQLYITIHKEGGNLVVGKTNIGSKLFEMKELLQVETIFDNTNNVKTYLYSLCYGCDEKIMKLLSIYTAANYDIRMNLVSGIELPNGKYMKYTDLVTDTYGNTKSDSEALLKIIEDLDLMLLSNNVIVNPDDPSFTTILREIKKNFDYSVITRIKKKEVDTKNLIKGDQNLIELIEKGDLTNSQELTNEDYNILRASNIISNFIIDSLSSGKNYDLISEWCNKRKLNIKTIMSYISNYVSFKTKVYGINNQLVKNNTLTLNDMKIILSKSIDTTSFTEYEKITLSFMHGYSFNVVKKINDTPFYLSALDPAIDTTLTVQQFSGKYNTLMDTKYLFNYLLFLSMNPEKNIMSCLHYITPKMISVIGNVYSRDRIQSNLMTYSIFVPETSEIKTELLKLRSTIDRTLRELHYDLINSHNINIWDKLKNIAIIYNKIRIKNSLETKTVIDLNSSNYDENAIKYIRYREQNDVNYNSQSGGGSATYSSPSTSLLHYLLFKKIDKQRY
jgi:hypothetical protein